MNSFEKVIKQVVFNGGLLILIPNIFNILFYKYLPEAFSIEVFTKNIPNYVLILENIGRICIFGLPFLFKYNLKDSKTGILLYSIGLTIYFLSWFALIIFPNSLWSTSIIGFTAPAFTPIIWLLGCAILFKEIYFVNIKYTPIIFITVSVFFTIFHVTHTVIVYAKNY